MSRICERALNFIQVINAEGDIRACSWNRNNIIGNLFENSIQEILNGEKARKLREPMIHGEYPDCDPDNCPYLSNGTIEEHRVDCPDYIEWPDELLLAYEGNCNYNCKCCTSYQHMADTRSHDYTELYDGLESRLREILPHVKIIGANGRGELFASQRTLKLLSEWRPLAPTSECKVTLETNGALFDEKHWKQIENLGQYDLSVAITVMSFNDDIYKYLSGSHLSVEKVIGSLHFVKSLHEKGIINHLELATVLQELNFREMPDFTRRCIEEFGADTVRIRPIFPGGILSASDQWLMDVRNPYHPYYPLYKKVMADPIFKDPHVLLWSADLDSNRGINPMDKNERISRIDNLMMNDSFCDVFKEMLLNADCTDGIWIYGLGARGKILLSRIPHTIKINGFVDKYSKSQYYGDYKVVRPSHLSGRKEPVIVTTFGKYDNIRAELQNEGYEGKTYDLYSLI